MEANCHRWVSSLNIIKNIYFSNCLSAICLIYMYICLFVYMFIFLFVYLSIFLHIYLSIHLFTCITLQPVLIVLPLGIFESTRSMISTIAGVATSTSKYRSSLKKKKILCFFGLIFYHLALSGSNLLALT